MQTPTKSLILPLIDPIISMGNLVSTEWSWYFRSIHEIILALGNEKTFQIQNDLSAKAFGSVDVNTTTDIITEANHNYYTGLVGQLTTDNTLPTGLSLATDYYVIALSDNTYSLATSLENAEAGTKINITAAGTGNHTFTPRGDVTDLKFNFRGVSQATVDFLIQRVTTSTGATELIESGIFVVSYNPTSDDWSLTMIGTPGPDDSGVDFSIDSSGQVQYRSSSITGTASISRVIWKARTLAGKHSSYSTIGTR